MTILAALGLTYSKPAKDDQVANAILIEQDRILHKNVPVALFMLVGVAIFIAFIFKDSQYGWLWLAYMLLLVIARLVVDRVSWSDTWSGEGYHPWRFSYAVGTLLTSLGWAITSPLLLLGTDPTVMSFGVLLLIGVAAGALPVMSSRIWLYLCYASSIILPLAAVMLAQGTLLYSILALTTLMLLVVLGRSATIISTQLTAAVRQAAAMETLNQSLAKMNAELDTAMAAAEAASRAKGEFLANMSHEIRTPLNAVLGFAQIGIRDSQGREVEGTFQRILNAGRHLLGVINDILDYSKIEAGKMSLESVPFRLVAICHEAVNMVAGRAKDKSLSTFVQVDPNLPEWVRGDYFRIQQILINLLSNAVKFTEKGRVSLHVAYEDGIATFGVSDTGIGISTEQISRLFSAFEQADTSTTRSFGGTGLGLSISRNLARMMHGDITVSSQVGKGSVFVLRLPLPESQPKEEMVPTARIVEGPRLQGVRVLVVDDADLNRLVVEDILNHEGAEVIFAEHGLQALERLADPENTVLDLVLMDVQMPIMDGYTAARVIREKYPELPVIAVTAHAMDEEREKCLEAGMRLHITKPIDIDELVGAIQLLVPPERQKVARSTVPVEARAQVEPEQTAGIVDWGALLARYPQTFIDRLVQSVLSSHQDTAAKLRNYIQQKDLAEIAFLAHAMKGVSGNIKAQAVFDQCRATEQAARQGGVGAFDMAEELALLIDAMLSELGGCCANVSSTNSQEVTVVRVA
jgi:signal transduction histidine kinase/CheY-like chemotaxis protein